MSMTVQRIVQTSDRHRTKVKKIAEQEAKKDKLHLMESILMQTVKVCLAFEHIGKVYLILTYIFLCNCYS